MGATSHSLLAVKGFGVPNPIYPFGLGGFYSVPFLVDLAALKTSQAWTIDGSSADYIFLGRLPIGSQVHGVLMNEREVRS